MTIAFISTIQFNISAEKLSDSLKKMLEKETADDNESPSPFITFFFSFNS